MTIFNSFKIIFEQVEIQFFSKNGTKLFIKFCTTVFSISTNNKDIHACQRLLEQRLYYEQIYLFKNNENNILHKRQNYMRLNSLLRIDKHTPFFKLFC